MIFRADFSIPQVSYCDYVWDNLEQHSHLPGLVCGLTGETLLHGEVRIIIQTVFYIVFFADQGDSIEGGSVTAEPGSQPR